MLGDHSWFYLPITYATRYVYMYIEGNIPVMMTMVIYIIITLLLVSIIFKGFNKWSGRTIKVKDWGSNGKRNLVALKREEKNVKYEYKVFVFGQRVLDAIDNVCLIKRNVYLSDEY